MVYRIRRVKMNDAGRVCWEDDRRTEYRSRQQNLLGKIIRKTVRGEERFYRVEAAKLEEKEYLR